MTWCLNLMASLLVAFASLAPTLAGWAGAEQVGAPQTITRTLEWSAQSGPRVLQVSNVRGDIRIVAEDRADVAVTATRIVERQVTGDAGSVPDFRQGSAGLLVCGDSSHCGCRTDWPEDRWDDRRERSRVRVDLELRVPRLITLDVCGINGGQVRVAGTDGPFTVRNVNGSVRLIDVKGSGTATTVNGSVQATFAAAPAQATRFKTVNGTLDITMPPSLSADLRLTTMHGGLYTDFETTALASRLATQERKDGRALYRTDRFTSVRVGRGGPELTFETLNGDIRVRKSSR